METESCTKKEKVPEMIHMCININHPFSYFKNNFKNEEFRATITIQCDAYNKWK